MVCVKETEIVAFYLLTFLGFTLGCLFIAPLADVFGRKLIFLIVMLGIIILYILIAFAEDYTRIQYYMLAYGICLGPMLITGLLLIVENASRSAMAAVIGITLSVIACVPVVFELYFIFISKHWRYFLVFGIFAMSFTWIFITFFVTESLRYLYDKEKYEELHQSLVMIHVKNEAPNPEQQVGATQYIKFREQMKKKEIKNSFSTIKQDPSAFVNLTCITVVMIASVFSAQVFSTGLFQTKVNLYGVILLTVVAVVSGYYIGFMAYHFGDFIVSIMRLCLVAIVGAVVLVIYT